ncbi:hypothetical protein BC830DRAFT_1126072 [Chytriomyces sp. MP71]|nr:hypothetical protein BC830DRAFT_1126072 [Chytriomyces sp. MP71]
MSTFATIIVGLTLPSLISQNSWRLGLDRPPLTPNFVNKSMLLRIGVTDSLQDMRILSPMYTLITHMFHHKDVGHWLSNMYALVVVTASMRSTHKNNLSSILYQSFLFFGGGVSGVFSHATYATLKRRQQAQPIATSLADTSTSIVDSLNWGLRALTGNQDINLHASINVNSLFKERSLLLCGSSAGVYALMGAEFVSLSVQLYAELKRLARLQRRPYLDSVGIAERKRIQNNIVGILSVAIGHVVAIASQVFAVSGLLQGGDGVVVRTPDGSYAHHGGNSTADGVGQQQLWQIDESIGYAAHLGGFLFGAMVESVRQYLLT